MDTAKTLKEYILSLPIINTHSHYKNRTMLGNRYNLDTILRNSYVQWCGVSFDSSPASRTQYLNKVRYKHYFKELEKAISTIYDLPDRLTAENWDAFNTVIAQQTQTAPPFDLLRDKCRYQYILLDAFWQPGLDFGRPDLFAPSFRVNTFLYGYNKDYDEGDGVSIQTYFPQTPRDIDEYTSAMREIIAAKVRGGCVALKSAVAYERGLAFEKTTKDKAQAVLGQKPEEWTKQNILHFENYIFHTICDIAAELRVPFQNHTGLGQLKGTNAMRMASVIDDHPETRFVLFHGSYPWTQDIGAMLHYYPNIYPDLCWLPMISPTIAEIAVAEMLEVGTADKLCWGCDTFVFEESVAARETMADVLSAVLARKVDKGYYHRSEAEQILRHILFDNPQELYRLKERKI